MNRSEKRRRRSERKKNFFELEIGKLKTNFKILKFKVLPKLDGRKGTEKEGI